MTQRFQFREPVLFNVLTWVAVPQLKQFLEDRDKLEGKSLMALYSHQVS